MGVTERLGAAHAAAHAARWAVGVALGVALGSYLNAVGGTGAPGVVAVDRLELVGLPLASGLGAFVVILAGRGLLVAITGVLRSRDSHQANPDDQRD